MSLFPDLRQEIEFCRRTYPGFSDVGDAMESLFVAVNEFACAYAARVSPQGAEAEQEEVDDMFRRGEPLCPTMWADRENLSDLMSVICDGVSGIYPEVEEAVESFREQVLAAAFPNGAETFTLEHSSIIRLLEIEPEHGEMGRDLCTLIVSLALYTLYRGQMNEDLRQLDTSLWAEGSCPVCGESPHYGLLDKDDGERILECWLCGTRWSFLRIKCPHCHNDDHETLGYFTVESMEICRVYFCRGCDQYLKIFDLQEQERDDVHLLIHNLATLSVDLVAANEGFRAGSGLQWVNEETLTK